MKIQKTVATFLLVLICLLGLVLPVLAWEDCPLGMVDDPYPGACRRYIDTNGDGICDHSQADPGLAIQATAPPGAESSTAPLPSAGDESPPVVATLQQMTTPSLPPAIPPEPTILEPLPLSLELEKLSKLSSRNLRRLTVLDLEESYGFPARILLSALAGRGIPAETETTVGNLLRLGDFSRGDFLDFLASLAGTTARATPTAPSLQPLLDVSPTSSPTKIPGTASPTPSHTPSQAALLPNTTQGGGRNPGTYWLTEEWVFFLGTIALLLLLKGLTLLRTASQGRRLRWLTQAHTRWWLNVLLTLSFALSFLSGLADFFALSFGWFQGWGLLIVTLHLDSSMVLLAVGFLHTLWHWSYYRTCFRRVKSLRRNPKAYRKWLLNLFLTASFLISLVSGLLELLALRFHWFLGASPIFLDLHLYSSLAMMAVGLAHALWHLPYYQARLAPARPNLAKPIPMPGEETCERA